MNAKKTGEIITSCRKQKNMTQMELATYLGISNKTISKWETGKGLPDIEFIQPLADLLQISVEELLKGEKIVNADQMMQITDWNTYQQKCNLQKNAKWIAAGTSLVLAIILLCYSFIQMQSVRTVYLENRYFTIGMIGLLYVVVLGVASIIIPGVRELTLFGQRKAKNARGIVLSRGIRTSIGAYGTLGYPYLVIRTSLDEKLELDVSWEIYDRLFPGDSIEFSYQGHLLIEYQIKEKGPMQEVFYTAHTAKACYLSSKVQPMGRQKTFYLAVFRTETGQVVTLRTKRDWSKPQKGTKGTLSWHYLELDEFLNV